MDILGGLATFGQYVNNSIKSAPQKKQAEQLNQSPRNGNNMYSSNEYDKNTKKIQNIAKTRTQQSKQPDKTGMIPNNYNQIKATKIKENIVEDFNDSVFTDDCSSASNYSKCRSRDSGDISDPLFMLNKAEKFEKKNKQQRKEILRDEQNSFLHQFDEMRHDADGPVSSNNVHNQTGNQTARMQIERELALDGGYSSFQNLDMTYGIVDKENFVHGNMKPFFGKGKGYGHDPLRDEKMASMSKTKIDAFTGTLDNPAYKHKQEQGAMFSPLLGATNPYGQPVMTDFYESRYIPGRERRNEMPFQQQRITPGLNLGYNEVSRQGFSDTYRVLPKTVDELRPANKPKITYGGVIIHGMKGQNGPVQGKVYKRRPLTFKEYSLDDLIPGVGDYRAQRITGEINPDNMASVNRGTVEKPVYGAAKFYKALPTLENMKAKVQASTRQNFKHADPRNVASSVEKSRPNDNMTHQAKLTQRAVYIDNKYIGPLGKRSTEQSYVFNTENNTPDQNMRNIHCQPDRAGFVGNGQLNQPYVYNTQNNTPDQNMRNIHSDGDRGNVGKSNMNQSYVFNTQNNTPDQNMRNIHSDGERGNVGKSGMNQAYVFNTQNNTPDQNMRNIHSDGERGNIGKSNMNQAYVFNTKNNIPEQNMRNVHDDAERGNVGKSNMNQAYVFDTKNNIPEQNMRNVHDDAERGNVGKSNMNQGYIFDTKNNIQDPTYRDIHNNAERGNVGKSNMNQGYIFDTKNNIPDQNMRNVHDDGERGNMGKSNMNQGYVFDTKNNIPDQNMRNVHDDAERGNVGKSNMNQGYVFDTKNNIPNPTNRDIHNNGKRGNVGTSQLNQGYVFDTKNNIPDPTNRDIHNNAKRGNVGTSQLNQGYVFDVKNNIPDQNMRNTHDNGARGNIGTSQLSQGYVFDTKNNIPDPTNRDIHNNAKRGNIGTSQLNQGYVFDTKNNIPEPTNRTIHNNGARGNVGTSQLNQGYVFDTKNNIPDPTGRSMHNNGARGNVGTSQLNQGYIMNTENNTPDLTMREIHCKNDHINPAKSKVDNLRTRQDVSNARINTTKEKLSKGRTPTLCNASRGPIMDYTTVQLCDPIYSDRELYPDSKQATTDKLPFAMKMHHQLPQTSKYTNMYVETSLQGNPFINNMVHVSHK